MSDGPYHGDQDAERTYRVQFLEGLAAGLFEIDSDDGELAEMLEDAREQRLTLKASDEATAVHLAAARGWQHALEFLFQAVQGGATRASLRRWEHLVRHWANGPLDMQPPPLCSAHASMFKEAA